MAQDASAEFDTAVDRPVVTWVEPIVRADWDLDGFGTGIDQLPLGEEFTIEHHLDDGKPDAVTSSLTSDPTGSMSCELVGRRVTALRDLRYMDAFNRTSAGPWGNLEVGGVAWQRFNGADADLPVSSGTGRIVNPDTGVLRYSLVNVGSSDVYVQLDFQFGVVTAATQPVTFWLTGRTTDTSNYYAAHVELLTTGEVRLRLFKRVAGSLLSLDSLPDYQSGGTNVASTDVWRVTLRCRGDMIRATLANITAATGTVTVEGRDDDLTTGTLVGPAVRRETGNTNGTVTVLVDDFQATIPMAVEMDGRQYFSRFNEDSPVYGYDRDVAPVTLEHGLVTSNGPERLTLFTGQMAQVSIPGRGAQLTAVSATRLAMARAIKPPVVNGPREGANATWLVNWVLRECGINISPPPRADCRAWFPFHGSYHPFLPYGHTGTTYQMRHYVDEGVYRVERPTFVDGPFSLGAFANQPSGTSARRVVIENIRLTPGEDLLSQASNRGRVEFWVRGDAAVTDGPIGAINTVPLFAFSIQGANSTQVIAEISSGRTVRLQVHDGISNQVYNPGGSMTIPTDDAWHSVGMAWSFANNKLWLYVDGTEVSTTSLGLTTGALSTTDQLDAGTPAIYSLLPISDLYFTTGPEANPDLFAWIDEGESPPPDVVVMEDFEDETYAVTVGGNWFRYNMTGPDSGSWSLRSAAIPHSGQTDCTITVPAGVAAVTFWYKVSSEHGFDYFRFLNNGITQFSMSGNEDWRQSAVYTVVPGQTLTFRYFKDNTVSAGMDAAFIDRIEFYAASGALVPFEPQAIVRPVDLEFEAIAFAVAEEAWATLHAIAKSTLSCIRTDELDRYCFLPPGYFVETEQLVNTGTISTNLNAEDPALDVDPSRIRNSVQVNFDEVTVDSRNTWVFTLTQAYLIRKGDTTHTFSFENPVVYVDESFSVVTTFAGTAVESVVSFNSNEDGSGTYYTSALVQVSIVDWDAGSITLRFVNNTGADVYIVNNAGNEFPFMGVAGFAARSASASTTVTDMQSGRTERLLTVTGPAIQRRVDGYTLAAALLGTTRSPQPEVTSKVMGDPRRQPGDLVTLLDDQGTKLSGQWRIMTITHNRRGASYTQTMTFRQELPIALWDNADTGWDEGVWAL